MNNGGFQNTDGLQKNFRIKQRETLTAKAIRVGFDGLVSFADPLTIALERKGIYKSWYDIKFGNTHTGMRDPSGTVNAGGEYTINHLRRINFLKNFEDILNDEDMKFEVSYT